MTGNAAFMARMAQPSRTPPQLTHVSVNLITPDSIRHLPLIRNLNPKFDELTFTRNQFRAFDEAAGQGKLSISGSGPAPLAAISKPAWTSTPSPFPSASTSWRPRPSWG